MKILAQVAFVLAAPLYHHTGVSALKCGIAGITKDCIGDDDPRYDEDVSNDLQEQAEIWRIGAGLARASTYAYGADGLPLINIGPYMSYPFTVFLNTTIVGSRLYGHRYRVLKPVPNATIPNTSVPLPGQVQTADSWSTSTHEKDGVARTLSTRGFTTTGPFKLSETDSFAYPVNKRTIYASGVDSETGDFYHEANLCLDKECTSRQIFAEQWSFDDDGNPVLQGFFRRSATKIDSADEWMDQLKQAYADANVPESQWPPEPNTVQCATGVCPSEEDWRTQDPNFTESPYQEPDGSLTAGFIAGITIASFFIVACVLFIIHRYMMLQQEQRMKTAFARSVASTIGDRSEAQKLSPEALQAEFNSIDTDNDGSISKEELKSLISAKNVASLEDKDFDVLFATMDLDHDEQIDFSEFCAFFATIRGEYDEAIKRKSIIQVRPSFAVGRASIAKSAVPAEVMEAIEEEDAEEGK